MVKGKNESLKCLKKILVVERKFKILYLKCMRVCNLIKKICKFTTVIKHNIKKL